MGNWDRSEEGKVWYREYQKKFAHQYPERIRKYQKTYRQRHPEKMREKRRRHRIKYKEKIRKYNTNWMRENRRKLRKEVIEHYGNKCVRCGINDIRILNIDHIKNNGNQHRQEIGAYYFPKWLKKNNYPDGYQVLCLNCNWLKHLEYQENKRVELKVGKN